MLGLALLGPPLFLAFPLLPFLSFGVFGRRGGANYLYEYLRYNVIYIERVIPFKSLSAARAKQFRENPELQQGYKSGAIAKARSHTQRAIKNQDASEGGHDLWLFTPDWKSWPSVSGKPHGRAGNLWTCRRCLRVTTRKEFHSQCKGRPVDCPTSQARLWNRLQSSRGNKAKLLQLWGLTDSQASAILTVSDQAAWREGGYKGETVGEARRPGPCLHFSCQSKLSSLDRNHKAVWREGGHRGERIGEAAHPGPDSDKSSSPKLCSINCQSAPGAWRALNLLAPKFEVLGLQETKLSDRDWQALFKSASAKGLRGFHVPGPLAEDGRPNGGVAFLTSKQFPCRFGDQVTYGSAQGLLLWSKGTALLNFYSPPRCIDDLAEVFLQLFVRNDLHNHRWLCMGDFNENPTDSEFFRFITAAGGRPITDGKPTRHEGDECLDWFAASTNLGVQWRGHVRMEISDHVPVAAQLTDARAATSVTKGRLKPAAKWPKPQALPTDGWRKCLAEAWKNNVVDSPQEQALRSLLLQDQPSVQAEWDNFMWCLHHMFSGAYCTLAAGPPEDEVTKECAAAMLRPEQLHPKGLKVVRQTVNLATRSAGSCARTAKESKRAKRLARLYEAQRLLLLKPREQGRHPSLPALLRALWSEPPRDFRALLLQVRSEIISLQSEQTREAEQLKNSRLKQWKQDMRENNLKKLVRWLKGRETEQRAVALQHNQRVAETRQEALSMLHTHWTEVWAERRHDSATVAATLKAGFGPQQGSAPAWGALTLTDLSKALGQAKISAGPDQWTATEVKYLPKEAQILFFELVQRWLAAGRLPRQLRQVRQVNLPKETKIRQDYTLDVKSTRPISVLSIWWRVLAGAYAHSADLHAWCQRCLHPEVMCLKGRPGAEEAAAGIHDKWVLNGPGYLTSLDWSQAYDRMDSNPPRNSWFIWAGHPMSSNWLN